MIDTEFLTEEDLVWIDAHLGLAADPRPAVDMSWVTFDIVR